MASNLEAPQATLKNITEVARLAGLLDEEIEPYGRSRAKVSTAVLNRFAASGKYVIVTSTTPVGMNGERAALTASGLAMALTRLDHRALASLRQASLGPDPESSPAYLVAPHEWIGDASAVALAHNLLAAAIDRTLSQRNGLDLDPHSITWPRVTETSDNSLRKVIIGLGGREGVVPRETSFLPVGSSEVMAILALSTSFEDLCSRLSRISVGATRDGRLLTAQDLGCASAMAALLQQALEPTLVQTAEHTPAFIHADSPADAGLGSTSILSDRIALGLSDIVVAESDAGSELGMEKAFDIKCRSAGLVPNAAVLVTRIRSLKAHGAKSSSRGKGIDDTEPTKEDVQAVERGCSNLVKHIENVQLFGVPVVVAVSCSDSDTDREIALVEKVARDAGAEGAFVADIEARGGAGAISLAEAVVRACQKDNTFKFLYSLDLPIREKVERIAEKMCGASGVDWTGEAEEQIARLTDRGYGNLPVCMVKTRFSLTHDERLLGRPRRYRLPVRGVQAAVGAGYLTAIAG